MRRTGTLLLAAAPLALASVVVAAEPREGSLEVEVAELAPEISAVGLTPEEYFANQAAAFELTQSALPDLTLVEPVQIEVNDDDLLQLETIPAADEPTPLRIGLVKPVVPQAHVAGLDPDQGLKNRRGLAGGEIRVLDDGTYSWARTIASPGAGGIRVHLRGVDLPEGAQLYFFSEAGEIYGPYVGAGLNGNGEMWTDTLFADTGVLMIYAATKEDLSGSSFTITDIGHILPRFVTEVTQTASHETFPCPSAGNPSCVLDATCTNSGPAVPAKLGTAKMEWIAGQYIYTCTGGLIADNNPLQDNYFLTANHCLSTNTVAATVQFYWQFATSSCNGTCPHPLINNTGWTPKTSGSVVRKTNKKGDYTLLQLNGPPPAGSVFLGWTSANVGFGVPLYRISNPNFGPQVYSDGNTFNYGFTCIGWPLTQRIYSKGVNGATDGGSSGSPVLNGSSQIVGQLSGACGTNLNDNCDHNSNATVDGRFSYYYSAVQPFINP